MRSGVGCRTWIGLGFSPANLHTRYGIYRRPVRIYLCVLLRILPSPRLARYPHLVHDCIRSTAEKNKKNLSDMQIPPLLRSSEKIQILHSIDSIII